MAYDQVKHLEFAQGVINRMGQNSFFIKGWAVTLVAALSALAAKDSNQLYITIAYFPTLVFWLLDGYYLYQERLFRLVYDKICANQTTTFSLSTKSVDSGVIDWVKAVFSKTVWLFYGSIIVALLLVMFVVLK